MGILYSEVKYYKSENIDFTDPAQNGGGTGEEIVNDTLHSIFPEISATERENGTIKRAKVFVSNESSDRNMQDCIFYIKQDVQPEDRLIMYSALENDGIRFNFTSDVLGSTSTVAAGTSIEISNIFPDTLSASDLVGRTISTSGGELSVASSADSSHIAFSEDIDYDILSTEVISTSDNFDTHESDEDFSSVKKYANSVIKSTVMEGVTLIDIPIVDSGLFEIGDNIVIVDEYFRATYRGEIADIQDSDVDENSSVITLNTPYSSTRTIQSLGGYVCNGEKKTLHPGDMHSLWMELTIAPTNAIDTEIINQFQIGVHFDDVAN
jgi:hypothetical protein